MKKIISFLLIQLLFYVTTSNAQWVKTNGPEGGLISSLVSDSTQIFAGTEGGGIYFSTNGNSWTQVNEGLSYQSFFINSLAILGTKTFAATRQGLFVSEFNGEYWDLANPIFQYTTMVTVNVVGTDIYAVSADYGLVKSSDSGSTWSFINQGLNNTNILTVFGDGSTIYAGDYGKGIFRSTDNGQSWNPCNNGMTSPYVFSFVKSGSKVFAGTNDGVFVTTDHGDSWTSLNNGTTYPIAVVKLEFSGTKLFASTGGLGMFISSDNGNSWTQLNDGLPNSYQWIKAITAQGNSVFTGVENGSGIYKISNNDSTWSKSNSGLYASKVLSLFNFGETIFAGTLGSGIFKSSDKGNTWIQSNNGLSNYDIHSFTNMGSCLIAGTDCGTYISNDSGNTWTQRTTNLISCPLITCLATSGTNLFAGMYFFGMLFSADTGRTWSIINNGLTDTGMTALAVNGSKIFAGTNQDGIFVSTDNGNSWAPSNNGLSLKNINSILIKGAEIFVGAGPDFTLPANGLFVSENNGSSWTEADLPGYSGFLIISLTSLDSKIFGGTYGYLFSFTNDGTSWSGTTTGLGNLDVLSLTSLGSSVYVGTNGNGVYINSNLTDDVKDISHEIFSASIFPNPAKDNFKIKLNDVNDFLEINIYNLQGDNVYSEKINGSFKIFSKEIKPDLQSGIYFIKFIDSEKQVVKKLAVD